MERKRARVKLTFKKIKHKSRLTCKDFHKTEREEFSWIYWLKPHKAICVQNRCSITDFCPLDYSYVTVMHYFPVIWSMKWLVPWDYMHLGYIVYVCWTTCNNMYIFIMDTLLYFTFILPLYEIVQLPLYCYSVLLLLQSADFLYTIHLFINQVPFKQT